MIFQEIARVLKTAQSASELTEKVFGPAGLLNRLAPSRKERKQFVNSPLFDRLQTHLNELHAAEERKFAREVRKEGAAAGTTFNTSVRSRKSG